MKRGIYVGGKAYRQRTRFKEYIRARDGYTCQLCGQPGDVVDHIIPYAISGQTTPAGTRILCAKCNLATRRPRKDALLPLGQWFESMEAELRS